MKAKKNGTDETICRAATETQTGRIDLCTQLGKEKEGWIDRVNSETYTFSSVQSLSRVWLSATPWIAARQASLSITNSQSSLRLCQMNSQWEYAVWCRQPNLVLCKNLEGWEVGERFKKEGTYAHLMADSCWCMAQTNTALWSNYPPIKNK